MIFYLNSMNYTLIDNIYSLWVNCSQCNISFVNRISKAPTHSQYLESQHHIILTDRGQHLYIDAPFYYDFNLIKKSEFSIDGSI